MDSNTQHWDNEARSRQRSKHGSGWRNLIRNFTPGWFSVNMGTGIVSILLNTLPYNGEWLYWISVIVFALNVLIFVIFLFLSILRYAFYPEIFPVMVTHPTQSLTLGAFPMGLATIINMICFVCVPSWGPWASYLAWGLWMANVVFSVVTCFALMFIMTTSEGEVLLSSASATWLLPIVSCVVTSASGSVVAEVLPNPQYALGTIVASYVVWGIGVPMALMMTVVYLLRLMLYKLPPKAVIASTFLPIGPLGQGGYGIQKLGQAAKMVFPQTGTLQPGTGDVLYDIGFLIGLIFWGFGLVWLFFAVATVLRVRRFSFNLGWWSFVFPLGVYATCTNQLGQDMPSRFFRVLGTILSLSVVISWMVVSYFTARGVYKQNLFVAPCLTALHEKQQRKLEQQHRERHTYP